MSSDSQQTSPRTRVVLKATLTVVVCAGLIAAAVAATAWIYSTEPTAQQEGATRKTAALVETIEVSRNTYRPQLDVLGLVEPARDVVLSPRVSGQIIDLEASFVPGGLVEAGEPLLKIDPADFERMLTMRQSQLKQVEATLAIEKGQQAVARQEFELLGDEVGEANRSLVLREPQIESIRAQVQVAAAEVEQAELDLERTTVKAPFDAQILSRSADVGSQVSPGDELARLVGVDEYWIMASVPLRDLRWIEFASQDAEGARVDVKHVAAWGSDAMREGRASRLIGTVDQQSRLARVLVTVADPLGRDSDDAASDPPLILGTIVELSIEGQPIKDVVRLPRDYLRQDNTVWVMSEDTLNIRTVDVVFRDAEYAYISRGLEAGEHVVTTSLATVTEGLALRRAETAPLEEADLEDLAETAQ